MSSDKESESTRDYYRVPCDMQVRYKKIGAEEADLFKAYAIRPSSHSSLTQEIDLQVQQSSFSAEAKFLFEKAFQILLSIDQRLDHLEERLNSDQSGITDIEMTYEWATGDLSASGIGLRLQSPPSVQAGDKILLDVVLPALPEHRFVATAEVAHTKEKNEIGLNFISIHEDDREFLHQYVRKREREILRSRAQKRNSDKKS